MKDDAIEQIKSRLDIQEVVGDYVKLQRSGRSYKGLCPFHQEKTPSFYVSPERQSWHCFGCGKGGDLFSFIMEIEGLSFPEALEVLGRRAGVEIQRYSGEKKRRNLYDVMEVAGKFYRELLKENSGKVARLYLERRDLSPDDCSNFELGWAPSSWRDLLKYMSSRNVEEADSLKCGLVIKGDKGIYDRFRGRVMFPIRDISGRLVAFGGRIIDGDGAKYLNSPETEIYSKRKTLYLIDKAKTSIRSSGYSILVEGYMDAIRLHLSGYTQAVATLGTSLTEDQAAVLRRLADNVFICYDADAAGQAAALRGMYVLQNAGLSVRVVSITSGKDPDDLLRSDGGVKLFQTILSNSLPLVKYHLSLITPLLTDPKTRKTAINELFEGLSHLEPVDIASYVPEIAALIGVRDFEILDALRARRLKKSKKRDHKPVSSDPEIEEDEAAISIPDDTESALFYLLWTDPILRREADPGEVLKLLADERIKVAVATLLAGESPGVLERRWLEMGDTFPLRVLSTGGAYVEKFSGSSLCRWKIFKDTLYRRRDEIRYKELYLKMLKREITSEEFVEYNQISKKNKSKS